MVYERKSRMTVRQQQKLLEHFVARDYRPGSGAVGWRAGEYGDPVLSAAETAHREQSRAV